MNEHEIENYTCSHENARSIWHMSCNLVTVSVYLITVPSTTARICWETCKTTRWTAGQSLFAIFNDLCDVQTWTSRIGQWPTFGIMNVNNCAVWIVTVVKLGERRWSNSGIQVFSASKGVLNAESVVFGVNDIRCWFLHDAGPIPGL